MLTLLCRERPSIGGSDAGTELTYLAPCRKSEQVWEFAPPKINYPCGILLLRTPSCYLLPASMRGCAVCFFARRGFSNRRRLCAPPLGGGARHRD